MKCWFCENNYNFENIYSCLLYYTPLHVLSWFLKGSVPGFWLYQGSKYTRVLNMIGVEYAMVTKGSNYTGIIPEHTWGYLNIPEYAGICWNMC